MTVPALTRPHPNPRCSQLRDGYRRERGQLLARIHGLEAQLRAAKQARSAAHGACMCMRWRRAAAHALPRMMQVQRIAADAGPACAPAPAQQRRWQGRSRRHTPLPPGRITARLQAASGERPSPPPSPAVTSPLCDQALRLARQEVARLKAALAQEAAARSALQQQHESLLAAVRWGRECTACHCLRARAGAQGGALHMRHATAVQAGAAP